MISKKRSKANFGTAMHVEYVRKKTRYIVKCEYFNRKTGYCKRNGFLVWDYGSEVCERCKFNQGLNNKEEDKNNSTINSNKKQKKNIYKDNERVIESSNARTRTVLDFANDHCELCGNKQKNLNIYIIDMDKSEKDSVFNIVALCNRCVQMVSYNNDKYREKLKNIAVERDYE